MECALRHAARWGLQEEIRGAYDKHRREGSDERVAALYACMDWDVAMVYRDSEPDGLDESE